LKLLPQMQSALHDENTLVAVLPGEIATSQWLASRPLVAQVLAAWCCSIDGEVAHWQQATGA